MSCNHNEFIKKHVTFLSDVTSSSRHDQAEAAWEKTLGRLQRIKRKQKRKPIKNKKNTVFIMKNERLPDYNKYIVQPVNVLDMTNTYRDQNCCVTQNCHPTYFLKLQQGGNPSLTMYILRNTSVCTDLFIVSYHGYLHDIFYNVYLGNIWNGYELGDSKGCHLEGGSEHCFGAFMCNHPKVNVHQAETRLTDLNGLEIKSQGQPAIIKKQI